MSEQRPIIGSRMPGDRAADLTLPRLSRDASTPDLTQTRRAYLIGVGGVGMSGAAKLLAARGIDVPEQLVGTSAPPPRGVPTRTSDGHVEGEGLVGGERTDEVADAPPDVRELEPRARAGLRIALGN